jgi:hypothetical protein
MALLASLPFPQEGRAEDAPQRTKFICCVMPGHLTLGPIHLIHEERVYIQQLDRCKSSGIGGEAPVRGGRVDEQDSLQERYAA